MWNVLARLVAGHSLHGRWRSEPQQSYKLWALAVDVEDVSWADAVKILMLQLLRRPRGRSSAVVRKFRQTAMIGTLPRAGTIGYISTAFFSDLASHMAIGGVLKG
jgi:hypothetical protein